MSTIVDTDAGKMPKISHLEALSEAPEKQQASIFAEVSEKAELENRSPTAKDFKAAVKAVLPSSSPTAHKPKASKSALEGALETAEDGQASEQTALSLIHI